MATARVPMWLCILTLLLVETGLCCPGLSKGHVFFDLESTSPARCTVELDAGILEGSILAESIVAFKGIPYAAPPVASLRWRPPQPVTSWKGIRPALAYSASCLQFPPPKNSLYYGGETTLSEDCLYLNIWTGGPLKKLSARRPVLVILHFGAYQFGSSSNPTYNGEAMARRGLTIVSINYRLGRLGFLAHPDLSAESKTNSSGNYGLMDQIAALQWVQRNIVAFGGDPDNVTLMGVSAGANSIHNLRCSPLAKNLFHRCIVASGPGFAPAINGYGHPANPSTLAAGEAAGVEVMALLGAETVEELRAFPAEEVMAVQLPRAAGNWSFDLLPRGAKISLHVFDAGYPLIDGLVLKQTPLDALLSNGHDEYMDVPMLASNTDNEASGLPYTASLDAYHTYLESTFKDLKEEALRLYPAKSDIEARNASWQLLADQVFTWSTWTAARLQARQLRSKVWYARFTRMPPIPSGSDIIERKYADAFHGADVMYALGNVDARDWNWTEEDIQLSHRMMDVWENFAKTGNPNGLGDTIWPALDRALEGPIQIWDLPSRVDTTGPSRKRMAFWDQFNSIADSLADEMPSHKAGRYSAWIQTQWRSLASLYCSR